MDVGIQGKVLGRGRKGNGGMKQERVSEYNVYCFPHDTSAGWAVQFDFEKSMEVEALDKLLIHPLLCYGNRVR